MDINKIFGAFNSSSRDDDDFPQVTFLTSEWKVDEENHPRYFIRMFTKLILNYTNYSKQLSRIFTSPDINLQEVQDAGEWMLYERAFFYLKSVDLHDKYHIKIIFEEATPKLEEALNKSLQFFENEEEYEKCAVLKKYLDFLNFSS